MNAPPAFDRRARPRVEWTFDRVSGKVDLVASGDGLEARITAASFAYAAHLTKLLLDAPPASAFEPLPGGCMGDTGEFTGWANAPELSPEVEAQAYADPEDTTEGLKAGEAYRESAP